MVKAFKFLHLSDTHLGKDQYGIAQRAHDFARSLAAALQHGVDEKVDFILIAGDFFDKKNPDSTAFIHAIQALGIPRQAKIPVFLIAGNHDKGYNDQESCWLDVLSTEGHCHLLNHTVDADGNLKLVPWNPNDRTGSYWDHPSLPVRILGVPYLGSATAAQIPIIASQVPRDDRYNVMMMHIGVSGQIPGDDGSVPVGAFAPLRPKVDYLGLGHYHKRFHIEGWIHNPGGTENREIAEVRREHGYLIVTVQDGKSDPQFFPGLRRPYHDLYYTVQPDETPTSLRANLHPLIEAATKKDAERAIVNVTLEGTLLEQYATLQVKEIEAELNQEGTSLAVWLDARFQQNVAHVRVRDGAFDLAAVERDVIKKFLPTALPHSPPASHDEVTAEILRLKNATTTPSPPEQLYDSFHAWRRRALPLEAKPQ